jgi:endoglucanase
LLLLFLLWLAPLAHAGGDWEEFRNRFVAGDGRIVDTGQGGISHSEGQGAGMLLAAAAGDHVSFDRIWEWTRRHLQVRDDELLAWRWTPGEGVTDRNDATDGDLLVAWALLRAHQQWHVPDHLAAALGIARNLREKALRPSAFGPLLLPGLTGFERAEGTVVNLSYWIFPALRDIALADPSPEWEALRQSGLALLGASRFGRWQLPADWIVVDADKVAVADGFPARFGYDAIRIPLYLHWAGLDSLERLQPYRDYWAFFDGARFMPAWTKLTDDSVDSHGASPGQHAVATLIGGGKSSPAADPDEDYYSAQLRLLCGLALFASTHR